MASVKLMNAFTYNQHFVAMMNVINAARLNPPYHGHNHHIVPRCWFKMTDLPVDNSKDNLVKLTYEDHVKVHRLAILCAATPEMKSKMGFAVKRLLNGNFSGMHHTDTTKRLIKSKRANQIITNEHKQHISEALKGKQKPPRSAEHSRHLSESLTGKVIPDSVRQKMSISNKHPKKTKENYKLTWGRISDEFKKYTAESGTLKWHEWIHLRKELTDGK